MVGIPNSNSVYQPIVLNDGVYRQPPPFPRPIVVCSLHANPLHGGHLDYLAAAHQHGDVWAIVNSDRQCQLKGSCPFMPEKERLRLVQSLTFVQKAFLSIDEDLSVCKTLRFLTQFGKVTAFLNGGPIPEEEVREAEVCRELGIGLVVGVGGCLKKNSSSKLIDNAVRWVVKNRPYSLY